MLPEILKTVKSDMESIKAELKNELKTTISEIFNEKLINLSRSWNLK